VTKAAKTEFKRMKRKRFLRNGLIFDKLKQPVWQGHLRPFTRKNFLRSAQFWANTLKIASDETTY